MGHGVHAHNQSFSFVYSACERAIADTSWGDVHESIYSGLRTPETLVTVHKQMTFPPRFPLRDAVARFDYKLDNGNSRLTEGLHKEYLRLLLENGRERERDRKRGRHGGDRVVLGSDDDIEMVGLDPGELTSSETRPPKRRLVAEGVATPTAILTSQDPRTPSVMQSPTQTPIPDMEEIVPTLPLPLPSASPVQSETKLSVLEGLYLDQFNLPATQAELIDQISTLLTYLSPHNQNHLVFRLLQNTHRLALCAFALLMQSLLKRDILSNLPAEISHYILGLVDHKTLLLLQQVCKSWYKLINNPQIWIDLLIKDKFFPNYAAVDVELNDPLLVSQWSEDPRDISSAQILYKKRCIIFNRWMDPSYEPRRISVKGHGNKVVTCLQHDDEKIITGVDDKIINIYCTKTGRLLRVLEGHESGVWALKYTGDTLVTGSTDRTARVWNIKTGKCTHIFRGHTLTIRCLDIIHPTVIGKDDRGEDIIFPHFPILVTGSRDMNIHVWRLPLCDNSVPDNDTPTFDLHESNNPYLILVLMGHTKLVRLVLGKGNLIILGSYDLTVRVWDLMDNGRCVHVLTGHTERVYSTALDFELKICFSGLMDNTINVWNIETGRLLKTLEGHQQLVGLLDLVDGVLVLAAADSTLIVWNLKTFEMKARLEGHNLAITCFQHDGLRVVSGLLHMLKLWDVKAGKFARDLLRGVNGGIWQVRIDQNRCVAAVQRISTVSSDETQEETYIEILDFSAPPKRDFQVLS